jgi:hypothetical protein
MPFCSDFKSAKIAKDSKRLQISDFRFFWSKNIGFFNQQSSRYSLQSTPDCFVPRNESVGFPLLSGLFYKFCFSENHFTKKKIKMDIHLLKLCIFAQNLIVARSPLLRRGVGGEETNEQNHPTPRFRTQRL